MGSKSKGNKQAGALVQPNSNEQLTERHEPRPLPTYSVVKLSPHDIGIYSPSEMYGPHGRMHLGQRVEKSRDLDEIYQYLCEAPNEEIHKFVNNFQREAQKILR